VRQTTNSSSYLLINTISIVIPISFWRIRNDNRKRETNGERAKRVLQWRRRRRRRWWWWRRRVRFKENNEEKNDPRRTTPKRMTRGASALRRRGWLARSKRTKKKTMQSMAGLENRLQSFWCGETSGDEVASTRSSLGAVTRKAVNAFILIGARSRSAGNSVTGSARTQVPLLLPPLRLLLIPRWII